jgi:predicted ATPase
MKQKAFHRLVVTILGQNVVAPWEKVGAVAAIAVLVLALKSSVSFAQEVRVYLNRSLPYFGRKV